MINWKYVIAYSIFWLLQPYPLIRRPIDREKCRDALSRDKLAMSNERGNLIVNSKGFQIVSNNPRITKSFQETQISKWVSFLQQFFPNASANLGTEVVI